MSPARAPCALPEDYLERWDRLAQWAVDSRGEAYHKQLHAQYQQSKWFAAPARFGTDGTVVEVTRLDQLYRVFERC